MPDPLVPADPGLLASILDTASLGGSAIRNILRGTPGGAARNMADILGRTTDALIPGDWISDLSGPEDRPEFRDVIDLGGDNAITDVLNFAGDMGTDPLTYVPGAAFAKAGSLAKQGISKGVAALPKAISEPLVKGAAKLGEKTRATFGAQRVSEGTAQALRAKQAASDLVGRAGSEGTVDALSGLSERELNALGEVGHNIRLDPATGKPVALLDPSETMNFDQRLAKLVADDPSLSAEKLLAAAPKFRDTLKAQWESGVAPASSPGGGIFADAGGAKEYFPRQFSGLKEDEIDLATGLPKDLPGHLPSVGSAPAPLKERKDWGSQDILDYLTRNPNVNLEMNAAKALGARASAQGEAAGRAQIGQSLLERAHAGEVQLPPDVLAKLPKNFTLVDQESKDAANMIAKQFPAEEATVLLNALNGMAPKGAMVSALDKLNVAFKGPAIYGAVIPKLGSITRNLVGGIFQEMAHAEARGDTLRAAARLVPNWLGAIDDGIEHLFKVRLGKNPFQEVENAFKASGGDPRRVATAIKDPTMREAVEKGVLGNTFVDTEQLVKSTAGGGWKSFGKDLFSYPAQMFKGAETRMRFGLFKALREKGKSPEDAARIVTEAFFDYAISSTENRAARSAIPFAQFMFKAIPSQAKFLAENPVAISALANLQGGSDQPIYPFMQGKTNIPLGRDEQGNQQYISSLGLPVEALSNIPNPSANLLDFGRQIEQGIVGASQPLLKTAYSITSGREPYMGSQYGSYGKLPVIGEAGAPGRAINQLLGTGLPGTAETSGILGSLGKATDDRTNIGEKALSLLTGAKIVSVDESRALQQLLENVLKRDPSVGQYLTLNNRDDSEKTQVLLDSLKAAKKDIKEKKKALVPAN